MNALRIFTPVWCGSFAVFAAYCLVTGLGTPWVQVFALAVQSACFGYWLRQVSI